MLEKIKAKTIHLLGGYTKQEYCNFVRAKFFAGKSAAYLEMLSEMWRNYGKSADEWCKTIYHFTKTQHYNNTDIANDLAIDHENRRTGTEP